MEVSRKCLGSVSEVSALLPPGGGGCLLFVLPAALRCDRLPNALVGRDGADARHRAALRGGVEGGLRFAQGQGCRRANTCSAPLPAAGHAPPTRPQHAATRHDLQHDFAALGFGHPRRLVRDTARGLPSLLGTRAGRPRKLRHLAAEFLQWRIQEGCHSPEEDAAAAMRLYRRFRPQFELAVARAEERREEARRRRAAAAEAGDDGEGAEWGESDQVGPVGGAGEASGAGSSSEPGGSSTSEHSLCENLSSAVGRRGRGAAHTSAIDGIDID